jgi:CubicO group peptidase (beta-lactamase class C family)
MLRGYVDRVDTAGIAAAVCRCGQLAYLETFGMQDMEAGKPLQEDTIFRIASMTKPVTAVAAMMLYEEGHFNLNTPIHKFISGFKDVKVFAGFKDGEPYFEPLASEVTFRHLFTHTAGLSYGWNPEDPVDRLYQEANKRLKPKSTHPRWKMS